MDASVMTFVLVPLLLILTLAYLGVHVVGLIQFLKAGSDEKPSKLSVAGWIVSVATGFTGPFVILGNLVSLVMGIVVLAQVRGGSATSISRIPARTTVVASSLIMVLTVLTIVFALVLPGLAERGS